MCQVGSSYRREEELRGQNNICIYYGTSTTGYCSRRVYRHQRCPPGPVMLYVMSWIRAAPARSGADPVQAEERALRLGAGGLKRSFLFSL